MGAEDVQYMGMEGGWQGAHTHNQASAADVAVATLLTSCCSHLLQQKHALRLSSLSRNRDIHVKLLPWNA